MFAPDKKVVSYWQRGYKAIFGLKNWPKFVQKLAKSKQKIPQKVNFALESKIYPPNACICFPGSKNDQFCVPFVHHTFILDGF